MVNLNRDIKAKTYGASEDFQITMEGRKAPINNAGSGITIETPLTATEMIGQLPNMKIVKTPTYVKGPDGFRKIEDAYPNSYGGQAVSSPTKGHGKRYRQAHWECSYLYWRRYLEQTCHFSLTWRPAIES